MRHIILLVIVALLVGCNTLFGGPYQRDGLTIPSVIYITKFKEGVPPQSIVDECTKIGQAEVLREGVGGGMQGGFGWLKGGNAYEACMKSHGYTEG